MARRFQPEHPASDDTYHQSSSPNSSTCGRMRIKSEGEDDLDPPTPTPRRTPRSSAVKAQEVFQSEYYAAGGALDSQTGDATYVERISGYNSEAPTQIKMEDAPNAELAALQLRLTLALRERDGLEEEREEYRTACGRWMTSGRGIARGWWK
ncbi:hypothetical protein C8J57DRAFT_1248178 [Mycena rebaudengoi]|nr:hypothetical protein C8J57DRAFT_1248178 [Mycena rebaudengoi]